MVRVAFYSPLLAVGGTQRHLQQVVRLLDPSRFSVSEVVTLRAGGEVEQALRASGIPVRSLDIGQRLFSPAAIGRMRAEARRLRSAPVDVLQGYQWRPSLIAALVGRMAGVPLIVAGKRSLTGAGRQARLAWRLIGRLVDTIVTNAEALQAEAEAQGVRGRWTILRNGVDLDYFDLGATTADAKRRLGLDPTRPVVGSVGRLEARKGHPLLIDAARHLVRDAGPRPQILLVGDGPLKASLLEQADRLGLSADVRLAGELGDVREALSAIDVFVLPSREEGMSNALLEAMAAARPIVATDVGGTREVLGDDTGLLVPDGDDAGLATAVRGLLADPATAAALGQRARTRVDERFGARVMIDRLEQLYAERLTAHGRMAA